MYHYPPTPCPDGQDYVAPGVCEPRIGSPDKDGGAPQNCGVGNPCNPATGNKYQSETDYQSPEGSLSFIRSYNSQAGASMGLGYNWTANLARRLDVAGTSVLIRQRDGRSEAFTCATSGACAGDADTHLTVTKDASGYTITSIVAGTIERYDTTGKLLTETDRSGKVTSYTYDANARLATVTGPYGQTLVFAWNADGTLASLTDPAGRTLSYSYTTAGAGKNLTRVDYPDGTAKLYHYENTSFPNHLTGISYVDASGNVTRYATYGYDANGKATLTEHAGGQQRFSLSYDSDTQTTVTDAVGTVETLTFAANLGVKNLLSRVNQTDGKGLVQVFDAQNNLICKQDAEGRVTSYTYNATNQKLSETSGQAGGCASPQSTSATRTTTYQYLSATLDLPTLISSPSVALGQSKATAITYGDSGHPYLPTVITQSGFTPSGGSVSRTVTLAYTAQGQLASMDGPRTDVNDITAFTYNNCTTGGGCGQLASVTNALNQVTAFESYDAAGRLLRKTDPNGLVTTYTYDARGRVSSITQTPPSGSARVTQYGYNAAGNVSGVVFPDGRSLTYTYDAAQELVRVTDNLGNYVAYGYDTRGNRTQTYTYDASGTLVRQVDTAYDLRNRVASVNAAGSMTQLINDAVGNLVQSTDPKANPPTTHQYDALNRLLATVNAIGGTTGYGYDSNDRLAQVRAPNGATTKYQYDDLGNLLQEVSPDRGTTSYTYDAAGNVLTQTDARGITATYTYDALNRVAAIHYGSGGLGGILGGLLGGSADNVTFTYDSGTGCTFGTGRLCAVRDASGTTTYAYDAFGNLVTEVHTELGQTYTTRYTYDAADRPLTITYPSGRLVTYVRDALGRIQGVNATVNGTDQSILTARGYRPDGLYLAETYGNGLNEIRQYDLQGRLTYQSIGSADTRLYGYDANGNVTSEQALAQVGAYQYDALDRLTDETLTTDVTDTNAYTYDANGNRTSDLNAKGNPRSYLYTANSNRLIQMGAQAITLDEAGNTTSDRNGKRVFAYSDAGCLAQVTVNGILKGTYTYDYRNLRTHKLKNATGAEFVYHYDQNGQLIEESRPDGTPIRDYVWADAQPIAQIHTGPKKEKLVYIHTDHENTPRLATDDTQTVVWRYESEAFGTGKPDTDPDEDGKNTNVRLRAPGQFIDGESGLFYNWNRYYDPKVGRYVSSDPVGLEGGMNTYVYVDDNPLRWTDPEGLAGGGVRPVPRPSPRAPRGPRAPRAPKAPAQPGPANNEDAKNLLENLADLFDPIDPECVITFVPTCPEQPKECHAYPVHEATDGAPKPMTCLNPRIVVECR